MRLASLLGFAALALGISLPLASLPVFSFGYWQQAEPLVVGLHLAAALASLSLACEAWQQPTALWRRLGHPFVLLPLALGLWSLLAAPFTDLPLLSLLGAPQSGLGGLWFLDAVVLTGCALGLRDQERLWRGLMLWLVGVLSLTAGLELWDAYSLRHDGDSLLIYIPAYYGWLALPLPLLVWRRPNPGRKAVLLSLAACLALGLLGQSITILAALLLWPMLTGLRQRVLRQGWQEQGMLLAVAVMPLLVLHGLSLARSVTSLWDRAQIQSLLFSAMTDHPAWLFGHGWGRVSDAFRTWLNQSGQRLWNPDWIFLTSDYFHCHNALLESLYATGLPGLLLSLLAALLLPRFTRPDARPLMLGFAGSLLLLSGLWFPLAFWLPICALGLAAVADEASWLSLKHRAWAVAPALLAFAQLAAAVCLLSYGLSFGEVKQAWTADPPRLALLPQDPRGSDLALAQQIINSLELLSHRPDSPEVQAVRAQMATAVTERAERTQTVLLLEAGIDVMTRNALAGHPPLLAEDSWEAWTRRLLTLAPGRSDKALPLLSVWLQQGRLDLAQRLVMDLRRRDPDDPVGLHYAGLLALLSGDPAVKAQGMALLRRSLDKGIDRFLPIDPDTRALLLQP